MPDDGIRPSRAELQAALKKSPAAEAAGLEEIGLAPLSGCARGDGLVNEVDRGRKRRTFLVGVGEQLATAVWQSEVLLVGLVGEIPGRQDERQIFRDVDLGIGVELSIRAGKNRRGSVERTRGVVVAP